MGSSLAVVRIGLPWHGFPEKVVVEDYFKASGEVLGFTLIVCWTITLIFDYDIVKSNKLKDRFGYNNLCVGFDEIPASLFGSFFMSMSQYYSIRYVTLDSQRLELTSNGEPHWVRTLGYIVNFGYMLSMMGFQMLFIISPNYDSALGHFFPFLLIIIFRWLVCFANYLEKKCLMGSEIPTTSRVWFATYTISSFGFGILASIGFIVYDVQGRSGKDPLFPPVLVAIFDYMWFICLFLTDKFLPKGHVLDFKVSPDIELQIMQTPRSLSMWSVRA